MRLFPPLLVLFCCFLVSVANTAYTEAQDLNITTASAVKKTDSDKNWLECTWEWLTEDWLVLAVFIASFLLLLIILIFFCVIACRKFQQARRKDNNYKMLGGDVYTANEPSTVSEREVEMDVEPISRSVLKSRPWSGYEWTLQPQSLQVQSSQLSSISAPPLPHPEEGAVDPYSPIFPSHIENRFSDVAVTPMNTTSSFMTYRPMAISRRPSMSQGPVVKMNINDM